ncbi:MAG: Arc family DNA-binding protein [Anaerovoracaceae bacterium]
MPKETTENSGKKQILLRLSPTLWKELAGWAEDDFRSINGQIEYLLTECVRQRKKSQCQALSERIPQR